MGATFTVIPRDKSKEGMPYHKLSFVPAGESILDTGAVTFSKKNFFQCSVGGHLKKCTGCISARKYQKYQTG